MHSFASGKKRNYYGKADVTAYRLTRDGSQPPGKSPVFGVNVTILIYGQAFWKTYTTGDNTGLIATDSMKNFIQRETMNYPGFDLESYCQFMAAKFLETYPHVEGAQVSAAEIPYAPLSRQSGAFAPAGPERVAARIEMERSSSGLRVIEASSRIAGFRLLRLNGSAFAGFLRDEYTTLPDVANRPLHMWLDLDWTYLDPRLALNEGAVSARVRELVHRTFGSFDSGSIQQIVYQMGEKILVELPEIAEVNLEANNRTWDSIAERDGALGVYTDSRLPFGCLGLSLRR